MTKFKIIDLQEMGTHSDELFDTKLEILEHLIDFHSIDYTGETPLENKTLEEILDYGEWDIEEVEVCPHCEKELEPKMIDVDGTNLEEHKICPDCSYGTPALL